MARPTPSYAITAIEPTTAVRYSFAPQPNMIDNGWFTVNQMGATTMPGAAGTLWIDRWRRFSGTAGTITWTSDGLTFSNTGTVQIQQRYYGAQRFVDGNTYRCSVLLADGSIFTSNITADNQPHYIGGSANPYFGIAFNHAQVTSNSVLFRAYAAVATNNMVLRALKVEQVPAGSSMAWDNEPDYAAELLKCQRYMYVVSGNTTYRLVGSAYPTGTAGAYRVVVPLSTPLIKTPTVSLNSGTQSNLRLAINGSYTDSSEMSIDSTYSNNMAAILNVTFGTATGVGGYAYMRSSDKLIFDAETYS